MNYGTTIELDISYEDAVPKVKAAFKEQGFGTLTEIDVKATLKDKIDRDIEPYGSPTTSPSASRWLRRRSEVDGSRVVLVGHSVGAGASLLVASRDEEVAAVVSIASMAHPEALMKTMLRARLPGR